MKLSTKIFIGVCVPTIVSIASVSGIMISKTHKLNLNTEVEKIIQKSEKIENVISANSNKYEKDILEIIEDSYKIKLFSYKNNELVYGDDKDIKFDIKSFAQNTQNDTYGKQIKDKKLYFSFRIAENNVIVIEQNIENVYDIKNNNLELCAILIAVDIAIVAIFAYAISKNLTKPINKINKEMKKVGAGDYNINLKESNSEFGIMSKNFNEMAKQILRKNEELLNLVDSKQLFIDDLSHEMNTPLTSIMGYAELLQKANLTEEQKLKFLNYIESESKRMRDIYQKLLLISYKNKNDFERKIFDVNNLLNRVQEVLFFELENKQINLSVENNVNYMNADETLIEMGIINLIKNAINILDENGMINVRILEEMDSWKISVIDNGPGISSEHINKIMEPFYRVDKDRSRKNGGAGLGLSICKQIANMHNGELKIESEVGHGSIFSLIIRK